MTHAGGPPGGPWADERLRLLAILVLAAAARAARWAVTPLLFNDGPQFIALAQAASRGDWGALLSHPYHPLYPLAVAAVQPFVPDWETAAVGVSVVSGTAAVAALYGFVRDAFGPREAWIAALLLAVHRPALTYTGDVQSEGLYLFLFLLGAGLLWRAWRRGSAAHAAGAGLAVGLAYATRPEGLALLGVAVGLAGFEALRRRWSPGRVATWCAALLLPAALCVGAYVGAVGLETGRWSLSGKKSLTQLLGVDEARGSASGPVAVAPGAAPRAREAETRAPLLDLVDSARRAFRTEMLVLFVLGWLAARPRPGPRAAFVLAVIGVHALLLAALVHGAGYVSARHAFPPLVLGFGHLAAFVPAAGALGVGGLQRALGRPPRPRPGLALAVVLLLAFGFGVGRTLLAPSRLDEVAERRAAEWLRAQPGPALPVLARRQRIAYYADAPFRRLDAERPAAGLKSSRAGYLILRDGDATRYPGLAEAMEGRARPLHQSRAHGHTARVYALPRGRAGRPPRSPLDAATGGPTAAPAPDRGAAPPEPAAPSSGPGPGLSAPAPAPRPDGAGRSVPAAAARPG